MNIITSSDFTDADGTTDWAAYRAAKIANGDTCYRCKGSIILNGIFGKPRGRQLCPSCQSMDEDDGDVSSESHIRCPKCRHQFDPIDYDMYEVFNDEIHQVSCPECDHDFSVTTCISYTFKSPPMRDGLEAE